MTRCTSFLLHRLVQYKLIDAEDIDIYSFGMECMILKFIHIVSYFCIAIVLQMPIELIIIGCALVPLRKSSGGYHAKTRTGCYVFSCGIVFLALVIYRLYLNPIFFFIGWAISNIVILLLAPLDNENKRLDKDEVLHYRKRSRIVLLLINLLCVVLYSAGRYDYWSLLIDGMFFASFLLILGKFSEYERENNVEEFNRIT
jgi:accessory gene regulator B